MTNKTLITIAISFIFIACSQVKTDNHDLLSIPDEKELIVNQTIEDIRLEQIKENHSENDFVLKFNEFELIIDSLEIWDAENKLNTIQKDSAIVYLELGETIEGKEIKIIQKKEGAIKVFQRFENSITIMDEGPHCDLTGWEHYYSEWEKLKITDGIFLTDSYIERDWEKFIEIDIDELKEAVKKQCGEGWAELIKEIKLPTEYPCGISISRVFLKIQFIGKETNTLLEQIISFEIPMGC